MGKAFGGARRIIFLLFFAGVGLLSGRAQEQGAIGEVNVQVGLDAQRQVGVSWTCSDSLVDASLRVFNPDGTLFFNQGHVPSRASGTEYTYRVPLTGLRPGMRYSYTVAGPKDSVQGYFNTMSSDPKAPVRFVYIADPQVKTAADAEAAGSNFDYINQEANIDFLYVAGDHTDKKGNGEQWAWLFRNGGGYPMAGEDMFRHLTLVSTQGNHDNSWLDHRIAIPSALGGGSEFKDGVYAVSAGVLRFIILNDASYHTEGLADNPDVQAQAEFLRAQVEEARALGQWVAVGFHKALYTGAIHVDDRDVEAYRRYWNPIFTQLDVDMVLAGHDHVYSRGFVDAQGRKASRLVEGTALPTYAHVAGAPLHVVAEHAGGYKWYKAVSYVPQPGDPLVGDYAFLDRNSAQEHPTSRDKREQTYILVELDTRKATFTVYKSKYDPEVGARVTARYIYDQFVVLRKQ